MAATAAALALAASTGVAGPSTLSGKGRVKLASRSCGWVSGSAGPLVATVAGALAGSEIGLVGESIGDASDSVRADRRSRGSNTTAPIASPINASASQTSGLSSQLPSGSTTGCTGGLTAGDGAGAGVGASAATGGLGAELAAGAVLPGADSGCGMVA